MQAVPHNSPRLVFPLCAGGCGAFPYSRVRPHIPAAIRIPFGKTENEVEKMRGNTMEEAVGTGRAAELFVPEGELSDTPENRAALRDADSLTEAMEAGTVLEAPCVLCDCASMELRVEFPSGLRGVIPRDEAVFTPDGSPPRDIAVITRVGKPVQFRVTGFRRGVRGERIAVCSRRSVQRSFCQSALAAARPGDLIRAKVTHLEPFGVFCDIGAGVPALLPVDRISVSRVSHPGDRFRVGDAIRAVILSKTPEGRVYLTCRELYGTWEENAALFSPGTTVRGIIRSVEEYGIFIELTPNLAGLAEPAPEAVPGRRCSAYIKSILPDRMKIKLALVDVGEEAPIARGDPALFRTGGLMRLSRWRYSPEGCRKLVETVFGEGET